MLAQDAFAVFRHDDRYRFLESSLFSLNQCLSFITSSTILTVPLASQVGGHKGVYATEDGSLVIKPALPLELQFYQSALLNRDFIPLQPFIPQFYGTLRLEGMVDLEAATADNNIVISRFEHDGHGEEIRDEYQLNYQLMSFFILADAASFCTFPRSGEFIFPIP
jgi:hypothetical protein